MMPPPILGADDLLPTPAISSLRRRKHWGRWKKSDEPTFQAIQRLLKRGRGKRSLNRIAGDAEVDRNFLIRILENRGSPDFKKIIAVVKVLGRRVDFPPDNDHDD